MPKICYVICGKCHKGYNPEEEFCGCARSQNAQLQLHEQPRVWIMPDGTPRFPGRNDTNMPDYYRQAGATERRFTSYFEHQQFCKANGLINHRAEGVTDSRHGNSAVKVDDHGLRMLHLRNKLRQQLDQLKRDTGA